MSSVTAAGASYSDLDARTEFVLNRVAFLASVTEVLLHESMPENKQKVAVWRDNNYIPLIVRCMMDPNEEIFDHAIWATCNLLASDDAQVVAMTRNAITDEVLNRLVQMGTVQFTLYPPTVRNGLLYLFNALSSYEMPHSFTQAVGHYLLRTVLTDKYVVTNSKVRNDFVETVANVAKKDSSAINELFLIDTLKNPDQSHNHSRLFHIIGSLAEQETRISPLGIHELMTYFTQRLSASPVNDTGIGRREMLWVLSNLMTELSAPTSFIHNDAELKNLVESIAWEELTGAKEDADEDVGYEALFVLSNYVSSSKHLSEEFQKNVANDDDLVVLFETCMLHDNKKVAAVAREGYDMISQLISTFYPRKTCEVVEAVEKSDETECEETPCDDYDETPCVDTESDTEKDVKCCEKPVPSASDLILGARRGNESAAVRRVVSLLVNSPVGEWAEVPSDWTVTIADLTTLQHLGYVIQDGYVGINPEVYSTY